MKTRILNIALFVILIVCVVNIVGMVVNIANKNAEIENIRAQIVDHQFENNELKDSLDPENLEDIYRIVAEDELQMATPDATIYKDNTGN